MRRRKRKLPIRIFLLSILSSALIALPLFFFYRYLTTYEHFKIRDPEYFAGQNIFKINLQKEAQKLSKQYPDYKRVVLKRVLPNRIIVDFIPPNILAGVKLTKYFYVDEEGTLFSPVDEWEKPQLPLITGLESRIPYPRQGGKYNENYLVRTLEFIDNLNKDKRLAENLRIRSIDLTNLDDVILFTTTGCKINLGGVDSLKKNLAILQRLIREVNYDMSKVEYIELRFREPVIKYK